MTPHCAVDVYRHNRLHVFNITTASVKTSNIKLYTVTEFLNLWSEHFSGRDYSYKKATKKSDKTDKTQNRTRNQLISKWTANHITLAVYFLRRTDL